MSDTNLLTSETTPPTASWPAGSRVAAFFDVDNTLLPGEASEVRFFKFLRAQRLVGWREILSSAGWLVRHLPSVSLQPLRERKLYLAGKSARTIEALGREFCQSTLIPSLSPVAVGRLDEHRQAGHAIVLVTGSLEFLIEPIARLVGATLLLAAKPEICEGLYTGQLLPPLPYGPGKGELLVRLGEDAGLNLTESYGYGDSPGDIAILQLVGHPLVVNPIRGMARVAEARGWPIARWE
jgi:HAD superfamily hydrolase (TIGR01490 family)